MDAWQDAEGTFHFKPRRVEFLSCEAYLQAVRAWHQAQEAALARVLGVGMWAFTEHEITAAQVSSRTQVAEELEDFELEIGLEGELDRLQRLLAAGFRVYYRPNG